MSEPYNRKMIAVAEEVAKNLEIKVHKGCYVALQAADLLKRLQNTEW